MLDHGATVGVRWIIRGAVIAGPPWPQISDHGRCRGRREGNENAFVNQALGRCGASAEGAETPAPPQSIFASVNQVPDFFPRYPRVPQELGRGQVPEKQPHIGAFSQEVGFGGGSLTVSGLRPSPTCHRSGATYFRFSTPRRLSRKPARPWRFVTLARLRVRLAPRDSAMRVVAPWSRRLAAKTAVSAVCPVEPLSAVGNMAG